MVTPQYAAMVFLSVLAAMVLMILIGTNTRLGRDKKVLFLLSAVLLIVSAAAEFLAVYLDGSPEKYRAVHIAFNPKRGKIADTVRTADAMMYQCKRKHRADYEALVPPKAAD